MNLVLYEGTPLEPWRVRELIRAAAGPLGEGSEVDLAICRTEEELMEALSTKAKLELERMEQFIPFGTDQGLQFLKLSEVCWFRGADHRLTAVLVDGRELRSKTRRASTKEMVAPLIQDGRFFRVSRAIFVNVAHVRQVTMEGVHMDNGQMLPISRKCYGEWMAAGRRGVQDR